MAGEEVCGLAIWVVKWCRGERIMGAAKADLMPVITMAAIPSTYEDRYRARFSGCLDIVSLGSQRLILSFCALMYFSQKLVS